MHTILAFYTMGSTPEIARVVNKQLSSYTYTFPSSPQVSLTRRLSQFLTVSQSAGAGLVRHSQPYCNQRIISVIHNLYFSGPTTFVVKFEDHFPLHQGGDGRASHEVPIPMVALVAMGVSLLSIFRSILT